MNCGSFQNKTFKNFLAIAILIQYFQSFYTKDLDLAGMEIDDFT